MRIATYRLMPRCKVGLRDNADLNRLAPSRQASPAPCTRERSGVDGTPRAMWMPSMPSRPIMPTSSADSSSITAISDTKPWTGK